MKYEAPKIFELGKVKALTFGKPWCGEIDALGTGFFPCWELLNSPKQPSSKP